MTNDVPSPTAADRERDLLADLAFVCDPAIQAGAADNRAYFEQHNCWPDTPWPAFPLAATDGWPAAIRRAIWAERLLAELREATDNERNHVGIWDSIDDEKRRQVMGAAMLRLVAAVNKAERLEKALEAIWWDVSAGMDMVGSMQPHDTIRQTIDEALGRTTKEGT